MYEAAVAHPDGASTASRLARTAARQGYEGLVVRTADADYDRAAIEDRYGVDVVDGVEIRADDPSSAAGHLGNVRSGSHTDYTVVAVAGGAPDVNRFAAESDRVDVLARPVVPGEDDGIDAALARAAREHGVRVEFDLGLALRLEGGSRVRALQALRRVRELVDHFDAPFVVSARADSHLGLRAPRELVAVGELVGFDAETVREGLREWGRLAERNRHRQSPEFIEPGVERGRYEKDDR
jgi:ribonuclease P/MRP protein subunit RPP1